MRSASSSTLASDLIKASVEQHLQSSTLAGHRRTRWPVTRRVLATVKAQHGVHCLLSFLTRGNVCPISCEGLPDASGQVPPFLLGVVALGLATRFTVYQTVDSARLTRCNSIATLHFSAAKRGDGRRVSGLRIVVVP